MLSQHPANLLLRFVLEVIALVVVGQWGWQASAALPTPARYALAFGLPALMAAVWAIFRAPGDLMRQDGKKPVVSVPGRVRLAIELLFFGLAIAAQFAMGSLLPAAAVTLAILLHHFWSLDRLVKLWRAR